MSGENAGEPLGTDLRRAAGRLRQPGRMGVENTPIKETAALTHPTHTPTKDDDTVVLELFVHGIPDQTGPDHSSARCRIVCHLRELLGVDLDSLGRRESGIYSVTAAFHLTWSQIYIPGTGSRGS